MSEGDHMVDESVRVVIQSYLRAVRRAGINARRAILFGSHARGDAREWSDIDLVVIAPELDNLTDRRLVSRLWELRAWTDSRIEPVPCGEQEWERDCFTPILDVASREGVVITD
jgi:predicted nucleotidyltransferase